MFPSKELLDFDLLYNKGGDCGNTVDTASEIRHCSNNALGYIHESQEDKPPHMDSDSDCVILSQNDHQSHRNDVESHSRASDGRSDSGAVASGSEGVQLDDSREEGGERIFWVPLY